MAVVDIKNLEGKNVGQMDLARRRVRREGEPEPAARNGALVSGGAARGNAQDQGPRRSVRLGQKALEAEGHGPRARRLDSQLDLAQGRHGARPGAAQLRLPPAAQNGSGRAALGAFGQAGRRKADRGGRLAARVAQDEAVPRGARTAWTARRRPCCWWRSRRTATWNSPAGTSKA